GENFQRIGAFKFRGACNALAQLTEEEKRIGVIAHSSGNHAQAVALAAQLLGIKATICMPENAPAVKVEATKGYGAEIAWAGNDPADREKLCEKLAAQYGYKIIPPCAADEIIAGAGTVALEIYQQINVFDFLFCPVGGGGLLSGNSIAAKGLCPKAKIIAVEPERADDAFRGIRDGKLYPSIDPDTIADGLRTSLYPLTFKIISKQVDQIITVNEKEIIDAMKFLWERLKIVVEPSGAVSLAGLIKWAKQKGFQNEKVAAIISGGNVDLTDFFNKYYQLIEGKY
ncbi:MAG: pyridoxal-phosphate dependent enzyme, partial [Spirochaetes bacterium]|nr:pyridoxal-phosphate dependent enzyme [Spirochaetota bacterium]